MAKSQVDRIFERDPLAFLKVYAISPTDFTSVSTGMLSTSGIYDQKPHTYKGGSAVDSTLTVERRQKMLAFTTLEESRDNTGRVEHNSYIVKFRTPTEVSGNEDDFIACWFLPWASNHLTKLQLPPKIPARPGLTTSLDPDLFFTAAINGCSVMVTGDPKTPIVTHGGTADSRSKLSENNAFEFGNARSHWLGLFQSELTKAGILTPIYGIHKDDYINYSLTGTTREAAEYEKFLKDNHQETMRIDSVTPEGSVFGLRDSAGNWSFYLQKKVRFVFTRLRKKKKLVGSPKFEPATVATGRMLKENRGGKIVDVPEIIQDAKSVNVTIEVKKFFPGEGKAGTSVMMDPMKLKAILESYM